MRVHSTLIITEWVPCTRSNKEMFATFKMAFGPEFDGKFWECLTRDVGEGKIRTPTMMAKRSDGSTCYIMNFVGITDAFLIKAAQEYGLPRGFPVMWTQHPNGNIFIDNCSGFYSKFENKDLTEVSQDVLKKVNYLRFFRKYSGYLSGAIIVRKEDGTFGYVVVSKNSANQSSKYIQMSYALWDKILTQDILAALWELGYGSIWAECMTFGDQYHAAATLKEKIVITGLSRRIGPSDDRPMWADLEELFELAKEYGFAESVDPPITVSKEKIDEFVRLISTDRWRMTETRFQKLLADLDLPVDSFHMEVSGDVLEGLVVHFYDEAGNKLQTVKYKFPGYNVRTFFLRACGFSSGELFTKSEDTKNFHPLGFMKDGQWRPMEKTVSSLIEWVQKWVAQDGEPDRWWLHVALSMAQEYDRLIQMDDVHDNQVAPWIRAADNVIAKIDSGEMNITGLDYDTVRGMAPPCTNLIVYLIFGPIGSGKTTFGEKLSVETGLPHLDGDMLMGVSAMLFGAERNIATMSELLLTLAKFGGAVISTGGGALSAGKVEAAIVHQIKTAFPGFAPKIMSFVAGTEWSLLKNADTKLDTVSEDVIKQPYIDQMALIPNIIAGRIERGAWSLPNGSSLDDFVGNIIKNTTNNFKFALANAELSHFVVSYPAVTVDDGIVRLPQMTEEVSTIVRDLRAEVTLPPKSGFSWQFRRLFLTMDYGVKHQTLFFGQNKTTKEIAFDELEVLDTTENVDATLVTIPGDHGCSFIMLDDPEAPHAHLTVNPGMKKLPDAVVAEEPTGSTEQPKKKQKKTKQPKAEKRAPAKMRDVTLALRAGAESVDLGDGDVLDLTTAQRSATTVRPLGYVTIPLPP